MTGGRCVLDVVTELVEQLGGVARRGGLDAGRTPSASTPGCGWNATRSRPGASRRPRRRTAGRGWRPERVAVAYPAITSSSAAASATERASGPLMEKNGWAGARARSRPRDGFRPTTPHHDEGLRIEPPPSEPCEIGHKPAASADGRAARRAAAAQLGVPRVAPRRVRGRFADVGQAELRRDRLSEDHESGPLDPRHDLVVVVAGTRSCHAAVAKVVRIPAVSWRSLIEIGTPRNGGSAGIVVGREPLLRGAGASRAKSAATVTYAPRCPLMTIDALEVELDELGRRHLAAAQECGLFQCGREREVVDPPVRPSVADVTGDQPDESLPACEQRLTSPSWPLSRCRRTASSSRSSSGCCGDHDSARRSASMSAEDFWGAQFDLGLAWIHFPEGHGRSGSRPRLPGSSSTTDSRRSTRRRTSCAT